jgi:hypothetical protein
LSVGLRADGRLPSAPQSFDDDALHLMTASVHKFIEQ